MLVAHTGNYTEISGKDMSFERANEQNNQDHKLHVYLQALFLTFGKNFGCHYVMTSKASGRLLGLMHDMSTKVEGETANFVTLLVENYAAAASAAV